MLWLIDMVGGAILLIIFGTKAWESTSNKARWIRLITGSLAIGILLGVLSHNVYPDFLLSLIGPSHKLLADCAIAPVLVGLTLLLEWLKEKW